MLDSRVLTLETPVIVDDAEAMMEAQVAAIPVGTRVAILAINDDAALGALTAFEKANRLAEVVAMGQNADRIGRAALRRPDLPFVGSTSYAPERYGEQLLDLAVRILDGEPVPPAAFCRHTFITARTSTTTTRKPVSDPDPAVAHPAPAADPRRNCANVTRTFSADLQLPAG